MWNVTYPPVIWNPRTFRVLFVVLLVQQLIGVVGETWLWMNLPPEPANLSAAGLRFILMDGAGLVVMSISFALLVRPFKWNAGNHNAG